MQAHLYTRHYWKAKLYGIFFWDKLFDPFLTWCWMHRGKYFLIFVSPGNNLCFEGQKEGAKRFFFLIKRNCSESFGTICVVCTFLLGFSDSSLIAGSYSFQTFKLCNEAPLGQWWQQPFFCFKVLSMMLQARTSKCCQEVVKRELLPRQVTLSHSI